MLVVMQPNASAADIDKVRATVTDLTFQGPVVRLVLTAPDQWSVEWNESKHQGCSSSAALSCSA